MSEFFPDFTLVWFDIGLYGSFVIISYLAIYRIVALLVHICYDVFGVPSVYAINSARRE